MKLEIYENGELVETIPVNPRESDWRYALDRRPPTAARGGVAVIVNELLDRAGNYATSAHSLNGPRWTYETRPASYRYSSIH